MLTRAKTVLLGSLVASLVVSWYSGHINPYFLDIITGIGINIILAASLKLLTNFAPLASPCQSGVRLAA